MLPVAKFRLDDHSEQAMLRFTIAILLGMAAGGTAMSADRHLARQGWHPRWHRTAVILPAGLPRRHYNFRTTISYGPPYSYQRTYVRRFYTYEESEVLFTPAYADVPYIPPLIGTPMLPGSSSLPGYYGSSYSYDYQGPYYGGPYVNYWDRLPYACGVYGYC
jgi:hypothetical protein